MTFDWETFLRRWSNEWLQVSEYRAHADPDVLTTGWLGYAGTADEQIAGLEEHLGTTLPSSYKAFLRVSNGWRSTSPFIDKMWSTEEVEWLSVRNQDFIDVWTEPGIDQWEHYSLPTTLEISDWGDSAIYLLNPRTVNAAGEWEAAFFANWSPGATLYPSFQDLMIAEYESFRRLELKANG